jgi:hypothetical protein
MRSGIGHVTPTWGGGLEIICRTAVLQGAAPRFCGRSLFLFAFLREGGAVFGKHSERPRQKSPGCLPRGYDRGEVVRDWGRKQGATEVSLNQRRKTGNASHTQRQIIEIRSNGRHRRKISSQLSHLQTRISSARAQTKPHQINGIRAS